MRAMGTVLVLLGAAGAYLLRRRQELRPLQVGQALLGDLAVLRFAICVRRMPLPRVLGENLSQGPGGEALWGPLLAKLRENRGQGVLLYCCWDSTVVALPGELPRILAPLGPLLPAGGERLGAAIDETREELAAYLRAERVKQAQEGRLTAGLCLAGACLLILVLI